MTLYQSTVFVPFWVMINVLCYLTDRTTTLCIQVITCNVLSYLSFTHFLSFSLSFSPSLTLSVSTSITHIPFFICFNDFVCVADRLGQMEEQGTKKFQM